MQVLCLTLSLTILWLQKGVGIALSLSLTIVVFIIIKTTMKRCARWHGGGTHLQLKCKGLGHVLVYIIYNYMVTHDHLHLHVEH
jgi:hypothetical protein